MKHYSVNLLGQLEDAMAMYETSKAIGQFRGVVSRQFSYHLNWKPLDDLLHQAQEDAYNEYIARMNEILNRSEINEPEYSSGKTN